VTGGAAQIVDKESGMKLAALRGRVWRCFGSSHMTNWFTDTSVFFCTEGPAITVSGWTDFFDFEGEDDTYSLLKIDNGAPDFEEARKASRVFFVVVGDCERGRHVAGATDVRAARSGGA